MKILICMITGMNNRGVDALVASKVTGIRKFFPDAEIDVFTREVVVNRPFLDKRGLGCIRDPYHGIKHRALNRLGPFEGVLRRFAGKYFEDFSLTERAFPTYDLAIVSGGDNMSSDYGSPSEHIYPIRKLLDAGVPVVMLGQSVGPFRDADHRESFLSVARDCSLITVRESASYKYVLDDLGLPPEKVRLTADTAFLLEPAAPELAVKMIRSFGIDTSRPVIALSVSGGITSFAAADSVSHMDALERLTRRLLVETDAQVLLIPHVEDERPHNNDLIPADELMRRIDFDPSVRLARGFFTSNEFKAIIAQCDMVIAERMHAAIAGLSSGIATFVIGYSVKGHGIMSDAFGTDSVTAGLVTPLADFMSKQSEDDKIFHIWNNRKLFSEKLNTRLPSINKMSIKNFEYLRDLFIKN